MTLKNYILALDTANEYVNVGIGKNCESEIKLCDSISLNAHRASNTLLLPNVSKILEKNKIKTSQLQYIASGIGPGSFTGVRIALASAKGMAIALQIPIIPINTLDAIAWNAWDCGIRGHLYVVADAMRHEIYPALFELKDTSIKRLSGNKVLKSEKCVEEAYEIVSKCNSLTICGDALIKYFDLFEGLKIANQECWNPTGKSLILATNNFFKKHINTINFDNFNPGKILPVYTRLSDAEENERKRLAKISEKNLTSGVENLEQNNDIAYTPMTLDDANEVAEIESQIMKTDAWNSTMIIEDLNHENHVWWIAKYKDRIIGYGGAMLSDNKMELLKIGVIKKFRNNKIASKLMSYLANDLRDLGATECILEVRKSNTLAQNFYEHLNFSKISDRKKYYKDGEDANIMLGKLPILSNDVGGMELQTNKNSSTNKIDRPIIFSIESSCDETAAAITCKEKVISDVVASQIDFHKRFGGVVPEIASRKHIEAICEVAQECMKKASGKISGDLKWSDIDAVSATYAPGLVGALVVGMAFAKGISLALNVPFIGVNHLEGHLYANKLSNKAIQLPAIASIISGGNTILVAVEDWGKYQTLGSTIDDAVGEAFDKVAKYLNLGYPGGPIISKLAKDGNPKAINFPRAMLHTKDYQFSLSGLKTAVINHIDKHKHDHDFNICDLCASFEQAIIDVQVSKAKRAIIENNAKSFLFGGGVAANPELRKAYEEMCEDTNVELIMAPLSACGDNAAMIGLVANKRYSENKYYGLEHDVIAHLPLDISY